jgi:PAS domain S-box-containing protein
VGTVPTSRGNPPDRASAEDSFRHGEDHLRRAIDVTPALIHSGLPDGHLDFFNQTWLKYAGVSMGELQGWAWTAMIHPQDLEGIVNKWRASVASGEPFSREARLRRADREYRWFSIVNVPMRESRLFPQLGSILWREIRSSLDESLLLRCVEFKWRS